MSETAGAGPMAAAARLDELAALTREYAAYSRTSHGIALIAFGVAFLAVAVLDLRFATQGVRFGYASAPLVWLVALWASRRRYQRHGGVIAQERPLSPRARAWLFGWVTMSGAGNAFLLVGWSAQLARLRPDEVLWIPAAAAAFVLCVTLVLVVTVTAGRADAMTSVMVVTLCWYLVIERRLAALREAP